MSPDEEQQEASGPGSPASRPVVSSGGTSPQGPGSGAHRTLLYLYLIVATAVLVILVALVVANREAVTVSWVFGSSSVSLVWLVLGTALLGLLLGLLLVALLRPSLMWGAVIIIVVLLAATAWFFLLRGGEDLAPVPPPSPVLSPSPSDSPLPISSPLALAGTWGRIDGVGGGLIVADSDGGYVVTLYDGALRPGESVPVTEVAGSIEGEQLRFTLPAQFAFGGAPAGPFEATLTRGDDSATALLRITGVDEVIVFMPLRRVAELVPAVPGASPSDGESPSAPAPPPGL